MTAFITRAQTPDSDFTRLLCAQGWEVHGQSLVTLHPLPFETVPDGDWIFFASQNAVRFFFRQVRKHNIILPEMKWAALGESTAEALSEYVASIDFTGNGDPETTASDFQQQTVPGRVLMPAARQSMQSIAAYLKKDFQVIYLEVYDNQPITEVAQRTEQVLVFTSPMNARTYFSTHNLQPFQKVVAIGATTARALAALGIQNVVVASTPNERSLAEAAQTVISDV